MTRKRTRRKVYALVNPITMAIEGVSITDDERLNKLRAMELACIDAIARGQGSLYDMSTIKDMANISETMALGGVGLEALEPSRLAQQELANMVERYNRTGRIGCTGPGLQAFREAYQYHDLQRISVSRSEYERFIKKTIDTIRSGGPAKVLTLEIKQQ